MEKIQVVLAKARETKGTYVYEEEFGESGKLPVLRTQYIQKWVFGSNPPDKIKVTIEPVIDFDLDVMVNWVENINPCMVWLGYDSGKNKLPEPKLEKVRDLHWGLAKRGFVVVLKTIREAWCEQ